MNKNYQFEIFLTSNHVSNESWLALLYAIGKLNGKFHPWHLFVTTELNEIRYFVVCSKILPPIINNLGEFMLKQEETNEIDTTTSSFHFPFFYLVTHKQQSILDIYDRAEVKHNQKLVMAKLTFFPYQQNRFFCHTVLYLQHDNHFFKKLALLNIPHLFLSINFAEHNRFLYRKNANKYLDIQKSLHLLKSDTSHAVLKIDAFPYLTDGYFLNLNSYDFDKHSIVIGSSGTGKSKFISSFIDTIAANSDYCEKYKIVVIDPHASLEEDIGGIENSSVIDFKTLENSIHLFSSVGEDLSTSTELLLSLFKSFIADQYNSKLERILRYSIHVLLVQKSLNFVNLRKLILDSEYRATTIHILEDSLPNNVVDFFLSDFNDLKTKSYQEAISPIISFIDEMELLPAFHTKLKLDDLHQTISENFLTIFSLDQVVLGERVTKTIAGLVMQQLLQLVQSYCFEEHIIFIVDEVAVIENPILQRFLSEARKYNLSLILAQQYFNQISEPLKDSIFANVLNYYVFRISRLDAALIEKNLQMEVAVHNSYHTRVKLLAELKNRECIIRVTSNGVVLPALKAKTLDFIPNPKRTINQILRTKQLYQEFPPSSISTNSSDIFTIDHSTTSLKEIMISQSSSRKKVAIHG